LNKNEKEFLNEQGLIKSFSKHANTYNRYAQLQKSMAERLATLLPIPMPDSILEVGCGTGLFTKHLLMNRIKHLTLNDMASGMLDMLSNSLTLPSHTKILHGNAEQLNFKNMDLICANAVFQWFQNPQLTLEKLNKALKNNGSLIFNTFGPKTLIEFRQSTNLMSPINLYNKDEWLKMIKDSGFSIKFKDIETRKIFFPSTMKLLKNLQQIGATPVRMVRTGELRKLMREYDSRFSTTQGIYSTWEIYYFSLIQ
jgi:malonyl-CoA O-methyltransferase